MKFAIIFDTKEEFDRHVGGSPAPAMPVSAAPAPVAPAPVAPPTPPAPVGGIAVGPLPTAPASTPAPPPPAAAAPAPPAPVAPAPAPVASGSLQEIQALITSFVSNPSKGGAAKLKQILAETYGPTVTSGSKIPPEHHAHAIKLLQYHLAN